MDLTDSYSRVFDSELLGRYSWVETRNAAAVLQASDPEAFTEFKGVLAEFFLYDTDLLIPGGNRGAVPIRLDGAFDRRGWSAVRVNTEFRLVGLRKKSLTSRSYEEPFLNSTVSNAGFEVDNMKRRVAVDVEWNAKDGNLDRDLAAYRALYDLGLLDVAVIVTRDHRSIRDLASTELDSEDAARRLGTTTTTNLEKVTPRLTRGDGGGCPVLIVAISRATWAGHGVVAPPPPEGVELHDLGADPEGDAV